MEIYIAGGGLVPFGKHPETMQELMGRAAEGAFEDARGLGLSRESVDAIVVGILNPAEFLDEGNSASLIADYLGFRGAAAWRVETASSTGAAALHSACHALLSGTHETVLVLAGEKQSHSSTPQVTSLLARMIDRSERQMGASMVCLAALITAYYAQANGMSAGEIENVLGRIAVKNRRNGKDNPFAHMGHEITLDRHANSRFVSTPLRLFDCGPISDGAAALLLTRKKTRARISGLGHSTDTQAISRRASLDSFGATKRAAAKAYRMAGVGPGDIQLAEIHDAFTAIELISSEDLGLFPKGGYAGALSSGLPDKGGSLPINASGGLLSRGHPIGASGLAQVVELYKRLGSEGIRRDGPPARGITLSMGGLATNNLVTIVETADAPPPSDTPDSYLPPPERATVPIGAPVPPAGVVKASTVLHTPPQGFDPPLFFALVEGEAAGFRRTVLARSPRTLEAGERVSLSENPGGVFVE